MNELKNETREIVKVVILNSQNVIIRIKTISYGGSNSASVDPKDIFMEAIKIGAPKIILVHNHPSGDATPSKQDCEFTIRMDKASDLLGVELLDHVVIGYHQYTSIKAYLWKKGRLN